MLVLEAIAKKEELSVSEEEFAEYIGKITAQEGDALTTLIESLPPFRRKEIERSKLCDKAMELVMEKAVATDEPMPEISAPQLEEPEADSNESNSEDQE